jgi:hypothetical protein
MTKTGVFSCIACLMLASALLRAQDTPSPGYVVHPNLEIRIGDLPVQTVSADATAALETLFHDPKLCCGGTSILEDAAQAANPLSLEDISVKIAGKHLFSDGHSITITADYLAPNAINPDPIIATLMKNQPALFEWDSHLYVLYGAVYDEKYFDTGGREFVIHKLLLLDTRFTGPRRETSFDRDQDDWKDVQGLLIVGTTAQ